MASRRGIVVAAVGYGVLAIVAACTNNDTTVTPPTAIIPGTTSVSVDPSSFLGSVLCSNQPGGIGSYVATLTDVTDPANPFTLPSSPPTPCSQSAYFQNVNVGDVYEAQVDGYTQTADQLVPTCGALPPGKPQSCTGDEGCPSAFGCQGRCKVTRFEDLNVACFQSCADGPDGGGVEGAPPSTACVQACFGKLNKFDQAGFEACLVMNCGESASCLQKNNDCLSTEFPVIEQPCDFKSPDTSLHGGVFHGAQTACTCTYLPTEGSRHMYLSQSPNATQPVTPAFSTSCAEGAPVQAIAYANVSVEPCDAIVGDAGASVTTILVDPKGALPTLLDGTPTCTAASADAGASPITSIEVVPAMGNPSALPSHVLSCLDEHSDAGAPDGGTPPATATFNQGVVPGNYVFSLNAYQGGSSPTLTSSCFARALLGATVTAMCDPLQPTP